MTKKQKIQENDKLLTEVELEFMTIIWRLNEVTVKDVISHLNEKRNLAYTTVATVMKVLEQKGFLNCKKETYAHVFTPAVSKNEYESKCIGSIVENLFDGKPVALVQRLLNSNKLDKSEIQAIENEINKLNSKKNRLK